MGTRVREQFLPVTYVLPPELITHPTEAAKRDNLRTAETGLPTDPCGSFLRESGEIPQSYPAIKSKT